MFRKISYNIFMLDFLDNIRNKPTRAKKRIAFFSAFAFTSIIFIFWFVAIYPSFKEQNDLEKKVNDLDSSPMESVGSVFSDNFSKIKDQFGKIKEIGNSFTKEVEYYTANATTTDNVNFENTANTWATVEEDLP